MSDDTGQSISLHDYIGGVPVIDRLVEAFYEKMDSLPEARELRAIHAPDLAETKRVLKLYLMQWMGGPATYSAERGHPRLRARHLPFRIGLAERDAWLLCMKRALDETVASEEARRAILRSMAPLADFMRNVPDDGNEA